MRIHIVHEFDVDIPTYEKLMFDPEFKKKTDKLPGLSRREVLRDEDDGVRYVTTHTKCHASGALTDKVKRFVQGGDIYWIDETVYDRQTHIFTYVWKVPQFKEVRVKGVRKITPSGAGRTRREIDGEIKVGVPLIGGLLEKVLSSQMEHNMNELAKVMQEFIREKRKSGEIEG